MNVEVSLFQRHQNCIKKGEKNSISCIIRHIIWPISDRETITGFTVEAEAATLWPTDMKSQLIGKDLDAGKVWGQKEKWVTKDEVVACHHWLSGHEFEQTLGDSEGQGSLACCRPWSHKESDMTYRLNNSSSSSNNNNSNIHFKIITIRSQVTIMVVWLPSWYKHTVFLLTIFPHSGNFVPVTYLFCKWKFILKSFSPISFIPHPPSPQQPPICSLYLWLFCYFWLLVLFFLIPNISEIIQYLSFFDFLNFSIVPSRSIQMARFHCFLLMAE